MDETNFYFEQASRAWGTIYKPAVLEKPKGKIPRRVMFATIGFNVTSTGERQALIHWVLVPPRKSFRPLEERIQEWEIEAPDERAALKAKYTEGYVQKCTQAGLKKELQDLGLRAPENTCAVMRDVLLRVGRTGSRVGELRARGLGRPSTGGQVLPATGNAFMTSEYLHQCLGTFLAGRRTLG